MNARQIDTGVVVFLPSPACGRGTEGEGANFRDDSVVQFQPPNNDALLYTARPATWIAILFVFTASIEIAPYVSSRYDRFIQQNHFLRRPQ